MSNFEIEAVGNALNVYTEMSAGYMAAIGEQPEGDAMLADLQVKAAADMAALGVVKNFVAELPLAERTDYSAQFNVEVADIPRIRGSVMWGPQIDGNMLVSNPWVTRSAPYYVVGGRQSTGDNVGKTEILLAPATKVETDGKESPKPTTGLLVTTAWTPEAQATESIMMAAPHTKVTTKEVERLFDPATQTLRMRSGSGVRMTEKHYTRWDMTARKNAKKMEAQYDEGKSVELPYIWCAGYSRVDFQNGLSREDRTSYGVFPRLVHLATLFGKTDVLRELVQNLHNEDERKSAIEALVTQEA